MHSSKTYKLNIKEFTSNILQGTNANEYQVDCGNIHHSQLVCLVFASLSYPVMVHHFPVDLVTDCEKLSRKPGDFHKHSDI